MPNYSGIWTPNQQFQARGSSLWQTPPGAPTSVTATAGNTTASVAFTAPADTGYPATITSYTVTSSPGGFTGTGASSPITVSGLTNGTSYTFTVTATNSIGSGTTSLPSSAVTPSAPFSVGTPATFKTAFLIRSNVWPLTTTKSIITYHDYDNNGVYAIIATLSGTNITYGTPVLVKSYFSPYGSQVVALDATKALIVYEENTGNYLAARVLSISGTTITVGSEVTNGVVTTVPALAPLTSTTALCVTNGARAFVISVSGTTPSFGSVVTASGGVNATVSVSALSSTSAVMIRDNNANNNNPTVNVMTISGTTVTMGSNFVIDTDGISSSSSYSGIAATSSTGAIAIWKTAAGSEYTRAVAMTISGTTPTFGTVQTISSEPFYTSYNQPLAAVSSTKALFVYGGFGADDAGGALVLTSSGTSLTVGPSTATNGVANTSNTAVASVDGLTALTTYRVGSSYGAAQVITVT